jgi:hypothetical protein
LSYIHNMKQQKKWLNSNYWDTKKYLENNIEMRLWILILQKIKNLSVIFEKRIFACQNILWSRSRIRGYTEVRHVFCHILSKINEQDQKKIQKL